MIKKTSNYVFVLINELFVSLQMIFCIEKVFRNMNKIDERVVQLEDELRVLKSQLQQSQAQVDLMFSMGKTEKERLQAALNSMLDGTLFHTVREVNKRTLRFDYISDTWEKIMGVSADESLSNPQKVFENFEYDDLLRLRQSIYDSSDLMGFNIEVRYNHPVSKKKLWLQITASPSRAGNYIYADGFIFDITKRKEAEQNLELEQKRLQALTNIPDGSLFRSARSIQTGILKFEHLYGKWEEIMGVSVEESLVDMRNIFNRIEPNDLKRLMQAIEESHNPLKSFEIECRYHHPQKEGECWLLILSYPRYDGDRIISEGFVFDITARKITENKLAHYRENLEKLVEERTNALTATNDELVAANEEMTAINEEMNAINEELAVTNNELKKYQTELEVMVDDRTKELRISQSVMQTVMDNIKANIFVSDPETMKILFANKTFKKWAGEDVEGTICWQALQAGLTEPCEKCPMALLFDKNNRNKTHSWEEFNQVSERWFAVESTAFKWTDERMVVMRLATDITDRKLAEIELAHAKNKAEESDRLKSSFLANMSHEIRTPLNGIVGFLQFLDSDDLTNTRRREYMDIIRNSSTQLTKIIDDIMDVSKIESKLLSINPEPVYLNDLMSEMHLFFETIMKSKNKDQLELILDNSRMIDDCIISVDAVRLRQVITNLIDNAVKFTDKGYIRFGYRQSAPDMLEFEVEDSGIGLNEGIQKDVIFEPFFQAKLNNKNKIHDGTGLGLPIARSLVQLMGGDMWVESTEGFGSKFYFTIAYVPV